MKSSAKNGDLSKTLISSMFFDKNANQGSCDSCDLY